MGALRQRGLHALDLRPVLRNALAAGQIYNRTDTHWTNFGALTAFNALATADGHPDWTIDPIQALGPPYRDHGGDLARMVGLQHIVTEMRRATVLPAGNQTLFPASPFPPSFIASRGRPGKTVLIVGDSFTEDFFAPFVIQHAGRLAWLHIRYCNFPWAWVERVHPDEVWWMPNERALVCPPGAEPQGLPKN